MSRALRALRKLARMPAAERRLHLRAFVTVVAERLGRRLAEPAPFPSESRARGPVPHPTGESLADALGPEAVGRAVEAAGRYVPGATCLVKARAAALLLRRRGFRPELRFGVRRDADWAVEAHAWVEVAGRPVAGGGAAGGYTPLARP